MLGENFVGENFLGRIFLGEKSLDENLLGENFWGENLMGVTRVTGVKEGDGGGEVDQGEVSTIRLGLHEASGFRK